MHQLEKTGDWRARVAMALISNRERLIGALLLGNNLVNILASALATSVFMTLFGEAGVALATLVMTALVLVFAEVLPKTWAISNPERFALAVSPIVRIVVAVSDPEKNPDRNRSTKMAPTASQRAVSITPAVSP